MRDSEDPNTTEQYHLEVTPENVADRVLLPGNPERVEIIADQWDQYQEVANHREYRTLTGVHNGTDISVTSTGIGCPSTAIAVEELARVGVDSMIRVGSCGAVQSDIEPGDLVITTAAMRQEGTSKEYVPEEYPASADDRVVNALVTAAERLGYDYHTGVTLSTDSFYAGQGRPGYNGYQATDPEAFIDRLQQQNIANIEMEASTICTLGNIYGLQAGAVCTVYANRITGEFKVTGENRAAKVGSEAMNILETMEKRAAEAGTDRWHPGLGL
ncbi:nucleoside phosphorylase [Salinarchaeum sp. IM2453]|uniref:nucleoside phosphorylase n=1 Tax=Salinarchaeum sp. IM2453 TaxID=2862870 RepID=UPI001C835BE2|nr:nucleoside phosphorylase [Salinarchaeum sp. IM2453]QZA89202.1 nucleoside phosphorylase [Salinarchaeum sp. IM2453]